MMPMPFKGAWSVLIVALAFGGLLSERLHAQSDSPVIVDYRIEKTRKDGRDWLKFSWSVKNVDRVTLLEGGRAMESRIQLRDGSFGWPPQMPGAFSISTGQGNFTLVAENRHGRVEATGAYGENGCFARLDPPGTHWQRCRRGGQIAANLSTTAPVATSCSAVGKVHSRVGFAARVKDQPMNPRSTVSTYRLETVLFRHSDGDRYSPINLSGRGDTRTYRLNGLKAGSDYVVALPASWPGDPGEIRFRCPSGPGTHVVRPRPLRNTAYRHEY